MSHVVDTWPLMKFEGSLQLLSEAEENKLKWLEARAVSNNVFQYLAAYK